MRDVPIEPPPLPGNEQADAPHLPPPLVTAVLVCWNHEKFVEEAIQSVLDQTYPRIELMVFDNGSTDGSRERIQRLADEHKFTVIFQDNIGLVRTLNRALQVARGKYFAVLSCDDVWRTNKTDIQVKYLESNSSVHLVFGCMETIDEKGQATPERVRLTSYIGLVQFKDMIMSQKVTNGPTVMARVSTLRAIGGYDEDLRIEDAAMAMKLTSRGYLIAGLPDSLTKYRRHGNNWTAKQFIWPDQCAMASKYCRNKAEYKRFVRLKLHGVFSSLASKNKAEALKFLLTQPVPWTWDDLGVGLVKLVVPKQLKLTLRRRSSRYP